MNVEYRGSERIAACKDAVWAFINDPANVAACMPDVVESKVLDSHAFTAVVEVHVGPVRGTFHFNVALDPQSDGKRMQMRANGGGFGSVVDLLAGADVTDNGDATTTLDWTGTATMRGPVATVGGRVLDAQARRVITNTFANVAARLQRT